MVPKTLELKNLQKTILMVENTDEGSPFVNANVTAQLTLQQYVTALMPQFNEAQINLITNLYKGLGSTVFEQASLVMGDCKLAIHRISSY